MTFRRIVATIAVCAGFLVGASVDAAAEEPETRPCATTPWRSEVAHQSVAGSWEYFFQLIWCVEDERISWVVPVVTPIVPDDSDCGWKGTEQESQDPVESTGKWSGFDMSRFSCPYGDDFPWGRITISPDGSSEIDGEGTA